ncbi:MAG: hypothetical protein WC465_04950 [Patescibacteria group bacterium]
MKKVFTTGYDQKSIFLNPNEPTHGFKNDIKCFGIRDIYLAFLAGGTLRINVPQDQNIQDYFIELAYKRGWIDDENNSD